MQKSWADGVLSRVDFLEFSLACDVLVFHAAEPSRTLASWCIRCSTGLGQADECLSYPMVSLLQCRSGWRKGGCVGAQAHKDRGLICDRSHKQVSILPFFVLRLEICKISRIRRVVAETFAKGGMWRAIFTVRYNPDWLASRHRYVFLRDSLFNVPQS